MYAMRYLNQMGYSLLVKSSWWSIINDASCRVELLLGYVIAPSSEKREIFGGKKGLKSSFN